MTDRTCKGPFWVYSRCLVNVGACLVVPRAEHMTLPFSVPKSRGTTGRFKEHWPHLPPNPTAGKALHRLGNKSESSLHWEERGILVRHPSIHPSSKPLVPITPLSTQPSTPKLVNCQCLEPVEVGVVVLEQTPASLHPREEHRDQAGNRLGWTQRGSGTSGERMRRERGRTWEP